MQRHQEMVVNGQRYVDVVNSSNLDLSRCGRTTWKKCYAESVAMTDDKCPGISDGT